MRVGFDEVGRGALAGPVVVGLVATPDGWPLKVRAQIAKQIPIFYREHPEFSYANDSKKLSPKARKTLVHSVYSNRQLHHVVLQGSNTTIDTFGIGKVLSHLLAIGLELIASKIKINEPIKVYIDGRIKFIKLDPQLVSILLAENNLDTEVDHEILIRQMKTDLLGGFGKFVLIREDRADSHYLAVALASNIAKVYRDDFMKVLALQYPDFGWEQNVGYGTKLHREAIVKNPSNQWLRSTWLSKIVPTYHN